MDVTIPKLKILGILTFSSTCLQLLSLFSNWFTLENSKFSIRAMSHPYEIDLITSECSTFQSPSSLLCFCSNHCDTLKEINAVGWISVILIAISTNFFIIQIFSIRRKVWKCEGAAMQRNLIDSDFFMLIGTCTLNAALIYWFSAVFKYRSEIVLEKGVNSMIIACVLHMAISLYYFIKVRAEIRNR